MSDDDGQVMETHSVSAGLDYPGVSRACSPQGYRRATYAAATDEAMEAFRILNRQEGILPALETSHALAWVVENAPKMSADQTILVNLSGRGDKDILTVADIDGITL